MRWLCLLLLLLGCSHDARRESLLDPELTPAVALIAVVDDTAGVTHLSWSQYEGSSALAQYLVLREHEGRTASDTLARITNPAQTTFVDTTVRAGERYVYRLSVVNAGGLEVPSEPVVPQALQPQRDETPVLGEAQDAGLVGEVGKFDGFGLHAVGSTHDGGG